MRPKLVLICCVLLVEVNLLHASTMDKLQGDCVIRAAEQSDRAQLELQRDGCKRGNCGDQNTEEPWSILRGLTLGDLRREGAHADATLSAEAGTLTCSGSVHELRLVGTYTFVPNEQFAARMRDAGFEGVDAEKLEAYTLFQISLAWVQSLKQAGVAGLNTDNLIALRIFKAEDSYVRELAGLGYPAPPADQLIALKVQGVDPAEVKQVRALGLNPDMDELVQMRIFKVTPEFIRKMQSRGLENLTIAKLVQIRIFKLAE